MTHPSDKCNGQMASVLHPDFFGKNPCYVVVMTFFNIVDTIFVVILIVVMIVPVIIVFFVEILTVVIE